MSTGRKSCSLTLDDQPGPPRGSEGHTQVAASILCGDPEEVQLPTEEHTEPRPYRDEQKQERGEQSSCAAAQGLLCLQLPLPGGSQGTALGAITHSTEHLHSRRCPQCSHTQSGARLLRHQTHTQTPALLHLSPHHPSAKQPLVEASSSLTGQHSAAAAHHHGRQWLQVGGGGYVSSREMLQAAPRRAQPPAVLCPALGLLLGWSLLALSLPNPPKGQLSLEVQSVTHASKTGG